MDGKKTFEIRFNDRGYQVGDLVVLKETKFTGQQMREGSPLIYTGREMQKQISYILSGYGLQDGWVILGIKDIKATKAQAVPEGFVLIKASDRDQEMLELIDQRDHMESQAEELKDKLQALYGVDFGEHSSCNFPFQNAIDYDDSGLVLVPKKPSEEFLSKAIRKYLEVSDLSVITSRMAHLYELMIKEAQEPAND